MKTVLLSTVALLGLAAGAMAADLPIRPVAPMPVAAPVFTWTGIYAGISGGSLFSDVDADRGATDAAGLGFVVAFPPADIPSSVNVEADGFLIGGTIGGNIQFGMFVAGIEADLSFADVDGSTATTIITNPGAFFPATTTISTEMDAFGTLRGRLGLAFDRFMIYGTGGLALASVEDTVTIANAVPPGPGGAFRFAGTNGDDWRKGWTAGAGVEWAFTNNLTFKIEWLHYELEEQTVRAAGVSGAAVTTHFVDYSIRHEGDIARGGVNFKF